MATDATGAVTTPDNIPTYNTAADAPSGKGLNAIVAAIQAALSARLPAATITTNGDMIYGTGAGTIARLGIGSAGQVLTVAGGIPSWAAPNAGAMVQICDLILGGVQASFDTNTVLGGNIPATYNHLLLKAVTRGDTAATTTALSLRFNNDATANYDWQMLRALAGTPQGQETFADSRIYVADQSAATAAAGTATVSEILISNYATTAFNKVALCQSATKYGTATGQMYAGRFDGHWRSAAAINRITLLPGAGNFVAGSRFTLYGII